MISKKHPNQVVLLDGATVVGAGEDKGRLVNAGIQATVTGSGAVSATVDIEVSNDGVWIYFDTLTLSGTDAATDGTALSAAWAGVRAHVKAISGAGASVNVVACV